MILKTGHGYKLGGERRDDIAFTVRTSKMMVLSEDQILSGWKSFWSPISRSKLEERRSVMQRVLLVGIAKIQFSYESP